MEMTQGCWVLVMAVTAAQRLAQGVGVDEEVREWQD